MDVQERIQEVLNSIEALKGLGEKVASLEEMQKQTEELAKKAYEALESLKEARKIGISEFDSESQAKRFLEWFHHAMNDFKQNKDLAGDVDAQGGYLVPSEFLPTLVRIIHKYGLFRQGATVVPMKTDELKMPALASGISVEWLTAQNSEITESSPTFSEVLLNVKTMAGLVPVANELIGDSALDVANLLATLFGEGVAKEEDRIGFVGSTGNGDPWNGILNNSGVNVVTLQAGMKKFSDVTADDLADMIDAAEDDEGAVFCMHRTVFNVVRKLKDSNGAYIYQPPHAGEPGTIWGYPYLKSRVMPKISESEPDTPFIWFGNLRYAYLGDRQQMSVASSAHAGFKKNQTLVRMIERIAIDVAPADAFSVLKTAAA